jgi:hypothetical protein
MLYLFSYTYKPYHRGFDIVLIGGNRRTPWGFSNILMKVLKEILRG